VTRGECDCLFDAGNSLDRQKDPQIGVVKPGDVPYDNYRAQLEEATSKDFARFHL
jgi:hypothetical protein